MLQYTVDTLDAVDENFHSLYEQADNGFRLKVTGVDDASGLKTALQSEREARKAAEKAAKEYATKFNGIDPEQARKLLNDQHLSEEQRLLADGKIDELVSKRTERMQSDYEARIQAAEQKAEQANQFASGFREKALTSHISDGALSAGIVQSALRDVELRARADGFQLDANGKPVALDANGETIYGKDGRTPLSIAEWSAGLRDTAPHLFGQSVGGGALGSDNSGAQHKKLSDMTATEEAVFARTHPEQYRKLIS